MNRISAVAPVQCSLLSLQEERPARHRGAAAHAGGGRDPLQVRDLAPQEEVRDRHPRAGGRPRQRQPRQRRVPEADQVAAGPQQGA